MNKKNTFYILFYMNKFFLCFLVPLFFFVSCTESYDVKSFEAMNTFMTVKSYGKNARKANLLVKERIEELENKISVTKEGSDVFRLNAEGGKNLSVSEDTFFLLQYGLSFYEKSGEALNPALYPVIKEWGFTTGNYKIPEIKVIKDLLRNTDFSKVQIHEENNERYVSVPENMQLDFGAFGKGYAGDLAVKILKEAGIKSGILDLGGNVQALGKKPDGSEWKVGVKSPFTGNAVIALNVADSAVITSGGYERYFTGEDGKKYIHIFDSKTGFPVQNECAGVTVVTSSGLYGDSLSTTLFVKGKEGAYDFWKKYGDFDFIFITTNNELYYTSGLENKISVIGEFNGVQVLR